MPPNKKQRLLQNEEERLKEMYLHLRNMRGEIQTQTCPPLGPILESKLKEFVPWNIETQKGNLFRILTEMNTPCAESWKVRLGIPLDLVHRAHQEAMECIIKKPNKFQK
jgi:hypothetical protein